ncbi:MAG: glycosyltransferase family 2 protein [Pseudomonadota bacterium]
MKLAIVVPCYNEEEVLGETASRLLALLQRLTEKNKISSDSKVYFVDDGSKDRTWELIEGLSQKHGNIAGVKLSRNRGHQNALLAGLFTAEGDAVISIDADLQDDINVMEQMVDLYHQGIKIVYGVRKRRDTDTAFKRTTALQFYKLMRALGVDTIENHADYRLMDRRAIEELKGFKEVNLFLRGIVPLLGFKSSIVYYDRAERFAGESKYPLKRMIALALNAITSFSVVPLRLIMIVGMLTFLFSLGMSAWALWVKFFGSQVVPGWASTVIPVYFISGIQILCIGVIGEYVGKLYSEAKQRPRYIIEKIVE